MGCEHFLDESLLLSALKGRMREIMCQKLNYCTFICLNWGYQGKMVGYVRVFYRLEDRPNLRGAKGLSELVEVAGDADMYKLGS